MAIKITMKDSRIFQMECPAFGTAQPATITKVPEKEVPARVMVDNIGSVPVFITHNSSALTEGNIATSYNLPVNGSRVFVVAPGQGLYAAGQGATGRVCGAISDSLPLFLES